MRDLALLILVVTAILLSFRSVYIPFLAWTWTSVIPITYISWGFMSSARINLIFALTTLLGVVLSSRGLAAPRMSAAYVIIIAFIVHASLSALFAIPGNTWNAVYYEIFIKGIFLSLFVPIFVSTRTRFHALAVLIVIAISLPVTVEGMRSLVTLGAHVIRGLDAGMLGDNNHFAAGVVTILPLTVYLIQNFKYKFVRFAFVLLLCLFVLCILGSRSRGGFVALSAVSIILILYSKNKALYSFLFVTIAFVFLNYFSDSLIDRLNTIDNAGDDASFLSRVFSWKVSSSIALEHPVFGGGFHAIQAQDVWNKYRDLPGFFGWIDLPELGYSARAAHSVYFELLGDLGFVGLTVFLLLLFNAFLSTFQIRRVAIDRADLKWCFDLAFSLRLCLIGYSVAGLAVSMAYWEVAYIIIMKIEALRCFSMQSGRNPNL